MDLLEFSQCELYFDEPMPAQAELLINDAARSYGDPLAEFQLLRAYLIAPTHLSVLVALYRYYFYQHRLDDALLVVERAMAVAGDRLSLGTDWAHLTVSHLSSPARCSFGLLRFYLLALKAEAVVMLRLGDIDGSRARLKKLLELDTNDRLGGARLLEVVDEFRPPVPPMPAGLATPTAVAASPVAA